MAGMDAGPGTDLGTLGWFVGIWVVMMAAMMFPSVSPTVALYSRMTRERDAVAPLLFAAGYLAVWSAAGVAAYGVFAPGRALLGDQLAWDQRRALACRRHPARGGRLRADTAQGRLPGEVPQPAGLPDGLVALRACRCAADGRRTRRLVSGLLLGADGGAVRAGRDEPRLDGGGRGPDRAREDASRTSVPPSGASRHFWWCSRSVSWPSRTTCPGSRSRTAPTR